MHKLQCSCNLPHTVDIKGFRSRFDNMPATAVCLVHLIDKVIKGETLTDADRLALVGVCASSLVASQVVNQAMNHMVENMEPAGRRDN